MPILKMLPSQRISSKRIHIVKTSNKMEDLKVKVTVDKLLVPLHQIPMCCLLQLSLYDFLRPLTLNFSSLTLSYAHKSIKLIYNSSQDNHCIVTTTIYRPSKSSLIF